MVVHIDKAIEAQQAEWLSLLFIVDKTALLG